MPSLVEMSFMVVVAAKWRERTRDLSSNSTLYILATRDQGKTIHWTKCLHAALLAFTRTSPGERRCILSTYSDSR